MGAKTLNILIWILHAYDSMLLVDVCLVWWYPFHFLPPNFIEMVQHVQISVQMYAHMKLWAHATWQFMPTAISYAPRCMIWYGMQHKWRCIYIHFCMKLKSITVGIEFAKKSGVEKLAIDACEITFETRKISQIVRLYLAYRLLNFENDVADWISETHKCFHFICHSMI